MMKIQIKHLFPLKIVAMEGINTSGQKFVVKKLYEVIISVCVNSTYHSHIDCNYDMSKMCILVSRLFYFKESVLYIVFFNCQCINSNIIPLHCLFTIVLLKIQNGICFCDKIIICQPINSWQLNFHFHIFCDWFHLMRIEPIKLKPDCKKCNYRGAVSLTRQVKKICPETHLALL